MSAPDPRQVPDLLVETLRHSSNLMQKEVQLAKAEMSSNLKRAGIGVAFAAVAGLLAVTALQVLAGAAVAYIAATGMSAGTAALIVATILLVIAGGLIVAAKTRLSADAIKPSHALRNIERDAATLKGAGDA